MAYFYDPYMEEFAICIDNFGDKEKHLIWFIQIMMHSASKIYCMEVTTTYIYIYIYIFQGVVKFLNYRDLVKVGTMKPYQFLDYNNLFKNAIKSHSLVL